jgi:diguanylate cyclase (GGDEF)-like protein
MPLGLQLPRLARIALLASGLAAAGTAAGSALLLGESMPGIALGKQVEILEDPAGALSLDDVRSGPASRRFVPSMSEIINLGYRDSVLWVRIRLTRGAAVGPWMLEVGYPLLDQVALYGPGVESPWIAGDHVPLSQRPIADRHLVFPVAAQEQGVNEYLLRVRQTGGMRVPLRLWDHESRQRARGNEMFLLGAYYGLLVVMVLYNLVLFPAVRDRAYAHYGIYVSAMGLLVAVNNGFGSLYLWPESARVAIWMQAATPPLTCATAAIFTRWYLLTRDNAPRADRVLVAIAIVGLVLVALAGVIPSASRFWVNHSIAAATITMTLLSGFVVWRKGYRPASFYLIAFLCVILGALLMVARNLGIASGWTMDYGMQVGSAFEVVLLSMGLADRIAMLRRERAAAEAEAHASQERLVEGLRESERLLESRVAERTEELETANRSLQAEVAERQKAEALLKESEERMRHQAQHDPLTGLPNRLLLRDRLVQATARAKRDRTTFAVLLVDLDHFKAVNDSLGHDVGDLLLVEVSQRLAACTRERDTIARLGGDEFVLVLEGLAAPEDSALVARKVVEALSSPFPIAGELLRTGPSIGISLYPTDGQDPDFLLKFADIAMYRAKAAGRNGYRFYRDPEELHAYDQKVP